jgi:very-short-patch-repair endonuclease
MSNFEESVIKILKKEKISFIREKTFQDLKKGLYRFDFYIPSINILIEVDGAQHYEFNKKFYKNRQDFLKAKERDRIKNSYALSHNIKLYRIPYWEVENIKCFSDIIQNKYLVETKWHNDLLKK